MKQSITVEEHKAIHVELHQSLTQLVQDFVAVTGRQLTKDITLKEFFIWSHGQCTHPTSSSAFEDIVPLGENPTTPVDHIEGVSHGTNGTTSINTPINIFPPVPRETLTIREALKKGPSKSPNKGKLLKPKLKA